VGVFDPQTDPTSPVAPRIQSLVDANRAYPSWSDFPSAPRDLPDAAVVATRVAGLSTRGAALDSDAARIEWTLGDAETIARDANSRIDASILSSGTARSVEEIEAFAEELRRRAQPPPPIPRR